jgi:glutamate-1-semialdehyde 2,1-aminomutase
VSELSPTLTDRSKSSSESLFRSAQEIMPGGVNSPVRAFRGVGGTPFFVARGDGARLTDVDGRTYIDLLGSWGPLVLGHAAAPVVEALQEAVARGTSYGAPTAGEVELAELIRRAVPSMEMLRLVSSGTEATMSALRLARGTTGRDLVVKFEGCYHGHVDSLLVKAGSGGATFGVPDSLGVPAALAALTVAVPFNDLDAVRRVFAARGGEVAAVLVEPVAGNMGVVPPAAGFLAGLRQLCTAHGALLIFDEVITGFRLAYGGAQARYGVQPDLTCLGKIIGGGLPVGAYGGRRDLLQRISPLGGVYQAGTLSGNPLAVAAGLATVHALAAPGVYERLEMLGARLEAGIHKAAGAAGVAVAVNRVGSMLTAFFTAGPVSDYASARAADTARYGRFFHAMLARGVFLAPSQFEAAFVSLAHREADIDEVARACAEAMAVAR